MHEREIAFRAPDPSTTTTRWDSSNDGWYRLTVALDGAPGESRSDAIDERGEGARSWSPLPETEAQWTTVPPRVLNRVNQRNNGVEGESNPHEDTRGIQPVSLEEWRVTVDPALPAVSLARCDEGIRVSLSIPKDAALYGLGEKTGSLDRRGRSYLMWNSDEPTHLPTQDPLYQSHPLCYIFTAHETITIFSDTIACTWVDAGEAEPEALVMEIYDDRCPVYIRRDATLQDAVHAYAGLVGTMPLPPEWALGFHQCRYSYYPEARLLEVAEQFRHHKVPIDVLYLDIHYMDGYRVFSWNPQRFPDPQRMIQQAAAMGFHMVTIIDPAVKADEAYPIYARGVENNYFLTHPDATLYTGAVWPGESVFPDFLNRDVQNWWGDEHGAILKPGISGIWNDMNEPADFSGDPIHRPDFTVPDTLVSQTPAGPTPFGHVHNGYANGMNAACRQGLKRYRSEERGFVVTRAGSPGVQRNAAVWTGDNHSWWEHLSLVTPMFTSLGLSGVPFVGGDAGGFQTNANGELYSRWIAAAAFTPFFRAHSALDSVDHEPWSFGAEALDIARTYIGLRYQLLPYLYTLFYEAAEHGTPIMRPLVWEFPQDRRVWNRSDSFMLGPALLVAPVREPGVQERSVYLPEGTWYHFWTGERIAGGQTIVVDAPMETLPLFVRGGQIIPFESVRQHTGEPGDGILRFLVAPDETGTASGHIYSDAGEGWGYTAGEYWHTDVRWEDDSVHFTPPPATYTTPSASPGPNQHPVVRWQYYRVVPLAPPEPGRSILTGQSAEQSAERSAGDQLIAATAGE